MLTDPFQNHPESRNLHEVTRILQSLEQDGKHTDALIPLVYDELRQLAASRLGRERPGQTLQATALVHEAYLRLLNPNSCTWQNRRHFFGAAAEAMRRILIENARRKNAQKRGGNPIRVDTPLEHLSINPPAVDILDLNEALKELELHDSEAAELVKLRHFAGLSMRQIAVILDISPRMADNIWAFAKAWLYQRLS